MVEYPLIFRKCFHFSLFAVTEATFPIFASRRLPHVFLSVFSERILDCSPTVASHSAPLAIYLAKVLAFCDVNTNILGNVLYYSRLKRTWCRLSSEVARDSNSSMPFCISYPICPSAPTQQ